MVVCHFPLSFYIYYLRVFCKQHSFLPSYLSSHLVVSVWVHRYMLYSLNNDSIPWLFNLLFILSEFVHWVLFQVVPLSFGIPNTHTRAHTHIQHSVCVCVLLASWHWSLILCVRPCPSLKVNHFSKGISFLFLVERWYFKTNIQI